MIDGSENDIEAQQQKQKIEVRRVIDVEESQSPVYDLLRRGQRGVIALEGFKLLLLDQHSDHTCDDQQNEQYDAERNGTEQSDKAVNQDAQPRRFISAFGSSFFELRRRHGRVFNGGFLASGHRGDFDMLR